MPRRRDIKKKRPPKASPPPPRPLTAINNFQHLEQLSHKHWSRWNSTDVMQARAACNASKAAQKYCNAHINILKGMRPTFSYAMRLSFQVERTEYLGDGEVWRRRLGNFSIGRDALNASADDDTRYVWFLGERIGMYPRGTGNKRVTPECLDLLRKVHEKQRAFINWYAENYLMGDGVSVDEMYARYRRTTLPKVQEWFEEAVRCVWNQQ